MIQILKDSYSYPHVGTNRKDIEIAKLGVEFMRRVNRVDGGYRPVKGKTKNRKIQKIERTSKT